MRKPKHQAREKSNSSSSRNSVNVEFEAHPKSYFSDVTARIRAFRDSRDWMQFHNPKNLACSISIEAAELLQHFQWKTPEESAAYAIRRRDNLAEEIADISIYLIEMADNLGIDLLAAIDRKLEINEMKYPIEKAKGSAAKYTELP